MALATDVTAPPGLHKIEQNVRLPKTVTIADFTTSPNPSASVKGESSITANGVGAIRRVRLPRLRAERRRAPRAGARAVDRLPRGDPARERRRAGRRPGTGSRWTISPPTSSTSRLALEVAHSASIAGITPEVARLTGARARTSTRSAARDPPTCSSARRRRRSGRASTGSRTRSSAAPPTASTRRSTPTARYRALRVLDIERLCPTRASRRGCA